MNNLPLATQAWVVYEIVGMCTGFQWIKENGDFRQVQCACDSCGTAEIEHPFEWAAGCRGFDPDTDRSEATVAAEARADAVVQQKEVPGGGHVHALPVKPVHAETAHQLQEPSPDSTSLPNPNAPPIPHRPPRRHLLCLKCVLEHISDPERCEQWLCPVCIRDYPESVEAEDPWVR